MENIQGFASLEQGLSQKFNLRPGQILVALTRLHGLHCLFALPAIFFLPNVTKMSPVLG